MKEKAMQRWIRFIAMVLTIALTLCALPMATYAQELQLHGEAEAPSVPAASSGETLYGLSEEQQGKASVTDLPIIELTEKREANVKHFRLSDGSYIAAQYPVAVHTKDENGHFADIDNTLKADATDITTSNARVKFAKKITGNERLYAMKDGKYHVKMSLLGAQKGTTGEVQNFEDAPTDTQLQKMMYLEKLHSRVLYKDILDGTDIEYILSGLNVKENLLVKEKRETYIYKFRMELSNLTAQMDANGNIYLKDKEEDIYTIPAPVVADADGVYAPSDAAWYTLQEEGNGKYMLTVQVDADWMNDAARAYPVTVDPTINAETNSMYDTYTDSSAPTTDYGDSESLCVGYLTEDAVTTEQHAYLRFRAGVLTNLANKGGNYISNAQLTLISMDSVDMKIGVYAASKTGDTETITWNNAPDTAVAPLCVISTYIPPSDEEDTASHTAHAFSWDLTEYCTNFINDEYNYGLILKPVDKENTNGRITFLSLEYSATAARPFITISYTSAIGRESYFPTIEQDLGAAGNGSVNLATGALSFNIDILSTTDSLMPLTLSTVYNTVLAGKRFTERPYTPLTSAYMPYGFRLNIQQTAYFEEISTGIKRAIYTDGDGTEHAFIQKEAYGEYTDEAGLGRRVGYDANLMTITHTDGTILRFLPMSEVQNGFVRDWHLSSIMDKHGNVIFINGTGEGTPTFRPTSISLQPYGVGPITMLSLLYYGDILCGVVNETTHQAVIFRYTNTYYGTPQVSASHYLRKVIRAKGTAETTHADWLAFYTDEQAEGISVLFSSAYDYDASGYLLQAVEERGVTNAGARYTCRQKKIYQIKEREIVGQTNIQGQTLLLKYSARHTSVISAGNDDSISTEDDINTHFLFDDYGRVASSYSMAAGNVQLYGATTNIYADRERNQNTPEQVIDGGVAVNLLRDGSFEQTGSTIWDMSSGNVWLIPATEEEADGKTWAKVTAAPNDNAWLSQPVAVENGEYIFTMLLKSYSCPRSTCTVKITSADGLTVYASNTIPLDNLTTDTALKQVTARLSVSALPEGEPARFTIEFSKEVVNLTPFIRMDSLMLQKQDAAHKGYSLINDGDFEAGSFRWSTTGITLWSKDTTTPTLGTSLKVPSGTSVQQTVIAPSDMREWDEENPSPLIPHALTDAYILSGYAKAAEVCASGNFRLRAVVEYYSTIEGVFLEKTYSAPFSSDYGNVWQYASVVVPMAVMETPDSGSAVLYDCIDSLTVYCDFTEQYISSTYYALFDNISLIRSTTTDLSGQDFDDEDRLIRSVADDGIKTYYAYDENSQITRVAYSYYELTDYAYDANSPYRVVSETTYGYKLNGVASYPYTKANPDSYLTKTIRSRTEYTYNQYGMCLTAKTTLYNTNGTATAVIRTQTTYDTVYNSPFIGQVRTETDSYGNVTQYFYYEDTGYLMATVDGSGNALHYRYNALGELGIVRPAVYEPGSTPTFQSGSESVTYIYDSDGNLEIISTPTVDYLFVYGDFGAIEEISAGESPFVSYTYNDFNGKCISMTYANGLTEDYVYDALDNLIEIGYTVNGGQRQVAFTYSYAADGSLLSFVNHMAEDTTVYDYDVLGRLARVGVLADGAYTCTVEYKYNDINAVTTQKNGVQCLMRAADGTLIPYTVSILSSHGYSNDRQLSSTQISYPTGEPVHISYRYDEYDRPTGTHFTTGADIGITVETEYEYNTETVDGETRTGGQISSYVSTVCDEVMGDYTFTYDGAGRILSIRNTVLPVGQRDIIYTYDNVGQLLTERNEPLGKSFAYTYDRAGNMTSVTETDLSTNQSQTLTFTYRSSGWDDQLVSIDMGGGNTSSVTYDTLGNMLGYALWEEGVQHTYAMTWCGNRMTTFAKDGSTTPFTFTYDDQGHRIRKTTADGIDTKYYYDGDRLLAEIGGTTGDFVFMYDGTGAPIGYLYRAGGPAGAWDNFFYERNLQGDIVSVLSWDGIPLVSYTYDAWGNVTQTLHDPTTVARFNPLLYRGYYYDSDLDMYWLTTRAYNPELRRFVSPDDISYLGANGDLLGYNMYAYCSNDPVQGYDPFGTFDFWTFAKGVGRIITGTTAVVAGVAVCIAGAPIATIAVASVAITTGALTVVNGAADTQQSFTGNNFVRDTVFEGNQVSYDIYSTTLEITAALSTAFCGNYLSSNCTMKGAVSGTESKVTLQPGTTLDRYGSQTGRYLTASGTPANQLALTPGNSRTLTSYVVKRPITMKTGIVAPCSWGNGGGIQYFSWMSVKRLIQFGFLTPIG